jgi:hypothetical protein
VHLTEYLLPDDPEECLPPWDLRYMYIVTNVFPKVYKDRPDLLGVNAGFGLVQDPVTKVMIGTTGLLGLRG